MNDSDNALKAYDLSSLAGIDGQVGMRLIYGTTAAEEKDSLARVNKVYTSLSIYHLLLCFTDLYLMGSRHVPTACSLFR